MLPSMPSDVGFEALSSAALSLGVNHLPIGISMNFSKSSAMMVSPVRREHVTNNELHNFYDRSIDISHVRGVHVGGEAQPCKLR